MGMMGTPSPPDPQRPQEPHNVPSGHQIILARGSQCCLGLHVHLPVYDSPKPTHELRVRAGTERTPACSLISPSESLVAPLFQMLWSDYVAKNRGEVEEVGLGRQIQ